MPQRPGREKRPLDRGKRWVENKSWFSILEGVEECRKRAAGISLRQHHKLREHITRRGTKRGHSPHGKRTQHDLVAAPGDVHLIHCRASCVKAMKDLLDGTGDQLPAMSHVDKPQVATGNQPEDTQHILARDTGVEGNLMQHWQGLVYRYPPSPRDRSPAH